MASSPTRTVAGTLRVGRLLAFGAASILLTAVAVSVPLVVLQGQPSQAQPTMPAGGSSAPATVATAIPTAVATAVPTTSGATLVEPQTVRYRAPVTGRLTVLVPFPAPLDAYGPGHRGVDLAAGPGTPVLAAGAGRVRFAGSVAGRGVVVIVHPDGISTEYEPVSAGVRSGQLVGLGQRIGTIVGVHERCAPARCLHWGARRGHAYLDPFSLLEPLGQVRLLPWR